MKKVLGLVFVSALAMPRPNLRMTLMALLSAIGVAAAEPGFTPLFNGSDLAGWKSEDVCWTASSGVIRGASAQGNPRQFRSFLTFSGGQLSDFELSFSFRVIQGRAGVIYRGARKGDLVTGYGYDFSASSVLGSSTAQLIDYQDSGTSPLGKPGERLGVDVATGRVSAVEKLPGTLPLYAGTNWHEAIIRTQGTKIAHHLDGKLAVELDDLRTGQGKPPRVAHRSGGLFLRMIGTNTVIEFKDVRLKKL